eukprot:scaffold39488_cov29-Tisochrysis_lutea.AAC.1
MHSKRALKPRQQALSAGNGNRLLAFYLRRYGLVFDRNKKNPTGSRSPSWESQPIVVLVGSHLGSTAILEQGTLPVACHL